MFCACGCGEKFEPSGKYLYAPVKRFIKGHNRRGTKHTEKQKLICRKSLIPWQLGKPIPQETKDKIGASKRGKLLTSPHREKLRLSHLGKIQSKEQIAKRIVKLRGKHKYIFKSKEAKA